MSFPKYEVYKESGVEWLGEVPEHWKIAPLKYNSTCNDQALSDATPEDYEIEYVEISDVDEIRGITGTTSYTYSNAPSRARRVVQDGDVLISTVRTYLRAITPVVDPPNNLIASTGFAVIRPQKDGLIGGYLGYLLRAEWCISEIISLSVGVSYPAINASDLVGIKVPAPPEKEQAQIARFLDHETAQIDALIAEQQRLIELLKEKRQAVISHAVTKGLDPTAPLKDSGVEWLGEVPAHWEIYLLRRAFRSVDYGISNSLEAEGNIAILRMGNIENGMIIKDDLKYINSVPGELILKSGDLLYNRTNSLDQIGKVGLFYEDSSGLKFSFASYLVRLRVNDESIPKYFVYLLNTSAILDLARASAFVGTGLLKDES